MAIPDQSPNSSIPGYLQPQEPPYPDAQIQPGVPLENFLQQWVAGISYMEETLVRPRWQLIPANLPDVGVDWCAVGITNTRPVGIYPSVWPWIYPEYALAQYQRHEEFELLCTFYGPQAEIYSSNLHDGACVWQNYSVLRRVGVCLIEVHDSRRVPELVRNQWLNRIDKEITFRRIVRRNYPILTLVGAQAGLSSCAGYQTVEAWAPGYPERLPMADAPQDGQTYGRAPGQWQRVMPLTGGTMEGSLRTAAPPEQPRALADKQYVDDWPIDGELY